MNRDFILIIVSFVILAIVVSFDFNYLNYKSPIPYANWKTITWEDFRGHKRPYFTLDGEDQFAFISTNLEVEQTNDGIKVTAFFHPSRSYVFNKNLRDKSLLTHELYHFHITELIARMMRRDLSKNKKIIDISDFQVKEDSMQQAYDSETYHSYILSKQKRWQQKIDSSLFTLEKFSNPVVIN